MGKYGINVPKGVAVSSVEEVRKAIQTTFPNEKEVSFGLIPLCSGNKIIRPVISKNYMKWLFVGL